MSAPITGLPAQVAPGCRVLVLGSMPGDASLAAAQYYAHPRNRFWPVMGALCGFDPARDYALRLHALQQAGVGLWDVIGACRRAGSLDAAIERGSEVINPVADLIRATGTVQAVALNGAKAAEAFRRQVLPSLDGRMRATLAIFPLPSTSPANAGMSLAKLIQAWAVLQPYCGDVSQ